MIDELILKVEPSLPSDFTDTRDFAGYDVPEFIKDVYKFLNEYFNHTNEFPNIVLNATSAYESLDDVETIALRHKIISRTYGQVSSDKFSPASLRSPVWAKHKELEDPNFPGYKIVIRRQVFDTVIEFNPWSKNKYESDKLAFLLEDIFNEYDVVFKKKGLDMLRFIERDSDITRMVGGTMWYGSPMKYIVRTAKFKREFTKKLEQLRITTEVLQ